MANRLFQGVISQMNDAIGREIGVIDEHNTVIASSELRKIGQALDVPVYSTDMDEDVFIRGQYTYKPFGTDRKTDFVLYIDGIDEQAAQYAKVLAVSLSNIKFYYDEKYDKANFVKNIILDNILPGDIYLKARELHFNGDVPRTAFIIRSDSRSELSVYNIIQNIFPDKNKDFVININENDVVLIKETGEGIEPEDLDVLANTIVDTLSGEFFIQAVIGIGSTANNLKELAPSFKEAQVAFEVGKVFDTEKAVINYGSLGIARLIYQLPTTLCESFLREVFKRGSIDSLDQEILFTIQTFFENNLNVSETSRKLFVHRNTLVYRLEKIKKITGLDLREFDHAIVLKIALMVNKYLSASPVKY